MRVRHRRKSMPLSVMFRRNAVSHAGKGRKYVKKQFGPDDKRYDGRHWYTHHEWEPIFRKEGKAKIFDGWIRHGNSKNRT